MTNNFGLFFFRQFVALIVIVFNLTTALNPLAHASEASGGGASSNEPGATTVGTPTPGAKAASANQQPELQEQSNKYCGELLLRHATSLQNNSPNKLQRLLEWGTELLFLLNPANLAKEAIQTRKTFREFQKWAKAEKQTSVPDHFEPRYIHDYITTYCGEITEAAIDSNNSEQRTYYAEKAFDPRGHAYYETEEKASRTSKSAPNPNH